MTPNPAHAPRIAAIVVAFNEEYQLTAFRSHHDGYRDQLYKHIVVDNGSRRDYVARLKEAFPSSSMLSLPENGGTTAAFNAGIRHALADPRVEAILLTVQDVQLDPEFLPAASSLLFSDERIAAVGGVVFSAGTCDSVESYGGDVDWDRFILRPNASGVRTVTGLPEMLDVDFIPGGVTLFRREALESVGLQDERLFMYCDELDWIFRAKAAGYRMLVTKRARAWHQHAPNPRERGGRVLRAEFYTTRNRIYLAGKHHGRARMLCHASREAGATLAHPREGARIAFARLAGVLYGAAGLMGRRLFAGK